MYRPTLVFDFGYTYTQAFLVPTLADVLPENPMVFWAETLGQDRPLIKCALSNKGTKVSIPGVAHTRSDVTITAHSRWPQGWELEPAYGSSLGLEQLPHLCRVKGQSLLKVLRVKLPQEDLLW